MSGCVSLSPKFQGMCVPLPLCMLDIVAREFLCEKTTKLLHMSEGGQEVSLDRRNQSPGWGLKAPGIQ